MCRVRRRLALSGSNDCTLKVWDLDRAEYVKNFGTGVPTAGGDRFDNADDCGITCTDVDWKSHQALSGANDCTLKLWDLDRAECIGTLLGHEGAVNCVRADWPSLRALSGSHDCTLKLWDLRGASCTQTLRGHEGGVNCVAVDWVIAFWDALKIKSFIYIYICIYIYIYAYMYIYIYIYIYLFISSFLYIIYVLIINTLYR